MRKFLLLIAVALFSTATYAQLWSSSISAVAEGDKASQNSPAAMDKDGNLYVTGTKTLPIEFAGKEVGGEDAGAYIAKYNAEGEEQYAIELIGSIDITAITTDAENNLYVAGSFAGGAMIQGVTGEPKTISNEELDSKTATFIAKYSAEGELLAVKSYKAEIELETFFDEVWQEYVEGINGYSYIGSSANVAIKKIVVEGGKVYAEYKFNGNVALDENTALVPNFILVWFMYYNDCPSSAVVSFDANLENPSKIAELIAAEEAGDVTCIDSFDFTVDGENVYLAAYGKGNLVLTTSEGSESFDFEFDGMGSDEKGALLSNVGVKSVKFSNIANSEYNSYNTIENMDVRGGNLYIAGTFGATSAFDNEIVATGSSDIFVASVNASELSVNWVAANACDESEIEDYKETVAGVVFGNESVYVISGVVDKNGEAETVYNNYNVAYDGTVNVATEALSATTVAYNDNAMALINCTGKTAVNVFSKYEFTSIESVAVETENTVIYDLTGRRVENIANAGIYIVNGKKVIVK